jgi:uncharacterized repeat protein (TIGR01451 family)
MSRHNDTSFLSLQFQNNIFYYDQRAIQYGYWNCPAGCAQSFVFDRNLYFNKAMTGGEPLQPFFVTTPMPPNTVEQPPMTWMSFPEWQALGEDVNSQFADPLFVDPTPGVDNYTLSTASPAFTMGFTAFDPSQAGRLPTATLQVPFTISAGYPPVSRLAVASDLGLAVAASASPVGSGTTLTYSYAVTNAGPNDADGATLTTSVPPGTAYVGFSTTSGTCTHPASGAAGTFQCVRSSPLLTAHSWGPITLTVKVMGAAGSTLINPAQVSANTPDSNLGNNSAAVYTKIQ